MPRQHTDADPDHLEDGLVLGLYTFQESRLRELEGEGGGSQLVVRLGLGLDLLQDGDGGTRLYISVNRQRWEVAATHRKNSASC